MTTLQNLSPKELLTIRIFNSLVNSLCAVKGLELVTLEEHEKFRALAIPRIAKEIEDYIAGILV